MTGHFFDQYFVASNDSKWKDCSSAISVPGTRLSYYFLHTRRCRSFIIDYPVIVQRRPGSHALFFYLDRKRFGLSVHLRKFVRVPYLSRGSFGSPTHTTMGVYSVFIIYTMKPHVCLAHSVKCLQQHGA